jgi:hypothetical protein
MRRVKPSLKLFREVALVVIRVKEVIFVLDIQRSSISDFFENGKKTFPVYRPLAARG